MYQALITPITNLRPHPNADRLQLATAAGHQVVVGLDTQEGTRGVYFPCDGNLSPAMLMANKLYRKHPQTGEPMGGYFEANGRVRTVKLRGQESDGYWTNLDALAWTGAKLDKLEDGHTFTEIGKHEICRKYINQATLSHMQPKSGGKQRRRKLKLTDEFPQFKEHYDTAQLAYNLGRIPAGAVLYLTEKIHGTSGRTGHLRQQHIRGWLGRKWHKWFGDGQEVVLGDWSHISGTRRVVINNKMPTHSDGKRYRIDVHERMAKLGLPKGMTAYYEIAGFTEDGTSIMPTHNIDDKKLQKQYGPQMVYQYGCNAKHPAEAYKVFIYRITMTNNEGRVFDLPWCQVVAWCNLFGLQTVPQIGPPIVYDGDSDKLLQTCTNATIGNSLLDNRHIREGIVLRVEHPEYNNVLKHKSFWFKTLEGIAKDCDEYVDPEEIESYHAL